MERILNGMVTVGGIYRYTQKTAILRKEEKAFQAVAAAIAAQ